MHYISVLNESFMEQNVQEWQLGGSIVKVNHSEYILR